MHVLHTIPAGFHMVMYRIGCHCKYKQFPDQRSTASWDKPQNERPDGMGSLSGSPTASSIYLLPRALKTGPATRTPSPRRRQTLCATASCRSREKASQKPRRVPPVTLPILSHPPLLPDKQIKYKPMSYLTIGYIQNYTNDNKSSIKPFIIILIL